jgi:hypothetical protein
MMQRSIICHAVAWCDEVVLCSNTSTPERNLSFRDICAITLQTFAASRRPLPHGANLWTHLLIDAQKNYMRLVFC